MGEVEGGWSVRRMNGLGYGLGIVEVDYYGVKQIFIFE